MTAGNAPITSAATVRTLYLLDDNADFRSTAKWWLGGAGYQVLDFDDPRQALDVLKALKPIDIICACLLLDVRMPVMSGMQVHDELIQAGITGPQARPALPIIYMTGHGDVPLAVQAMEKGAVTFLEKPFQDQALESALERAFNTGQHSLAPSAADLPGFEYHRRISTLTPREAEVFKHMLTGHTSKAIARELGVTPKNVEHFRGRVLKKMKADSLAHLMRMESDKRV
ncbi:MAG: response regulator [Desulfovibrionaceae bacterium]|jgi:FixJ family two-component response regulator|nr:response regulator [Desulfovibrionaceae bacterium]